MARSTPGPAPDLILFNGKISTMDANDSVVEAIAIRGGEVYETGSDADDHAARASRTRG